MAAASALCLRERRERGGRPWTCRCLGRHLSAQLCNGPFWKAPHTHTQAVLPPHPLSAAVRTSQPSSALIPSGTPCPRIAPGCQLAARPSRHCSRQRPPVGLGVRGGQGRVLVQGSSKPQPPLFTEASTCGFSEGQRGRGAVGFRESVARPSHHCSRQLPPAIHAQVWCKGKGSHKLEPLPSLRLPPPIMTNMSECVLSPPPTAPSSPAGPAAPFHCVCTPAPLSAR